MQLEVILVTYNAFDRKPRCCTHHHREKGVSRLQAHALSVYLRDVDDNTCPFKVHRSYMDGFYRGLIACLVRTTNG